MKDYIDEYGTYRSIDPEHTLPNLAWKLDTSLPIRNDEILIRVHIINVNAASFNQIAGSDNPDPIEIAKKISSIVDLRGKLHNPITGTGGTMMGTVEAVGIRHPEYGNVKKGDRICTLISTSFMPLKIDRIRSINMNTRQIEVEGYAILFKDNYLSKVPDGWNPNVYLAIVGEAGSCYESGLRCRPDSTVLLIGASEKVGLLSLFALREKLGSTGKLIAVTRKNDCYEELKSLKAADMVVVADFRKPMEAYAVLKRALPKDTIIDYTVNCASSSGHEMLAVLMTRECGMVYFANPATSYSEASLGAEAIGKEIDLMFYRGYIKGHVAFCMKLVNKYPQILKWFEKRYNNKNKDGVYVIPKGIAEHAAGSGSGSNALLPNIVVSGPEMSRVIDVAKRIANYNTTVLIEGESGTGKEVIADVIKTLSDRNDAPFIKINCAAIAENLFESEFFGYESGAFTGALKGGKAGHFENADGGTLFLDEIGELGLADQVKLLRVLQQREVVRVGASKARKVDVRLIAATNKDLSDMVAKGQFREDLYYRLNVINIHIPALRERTGDLQALLENFNKNYNELYNMNKHFTAEAIRCMKCYSWPGNVRELENMVNRLMLITEGNSIDAMHLPKEIRDAAEQAKLSAAAREAAQGAPRGAGYGAAEEAAQGSVQAAVRGTAQDTARGSVQSNARGTVQEATHGTVQGSTQDAAYLTGAGRELSAGEGVSGAAGDTHGSAAAAYEPRIPAGGCMQQELTAAGTVRDLVEQLVAKTIAGMRMEGIGEKAQYQFLSEKCRSTREIARIMGVSQSTVVRRMQSYGIVMRK